LEKEKEGEYSFEIQVDSIIRYKDMDIMNKELEEISKSKGIFNYLIKRKLDINNSDEQDIINDNNESIGKFNIIFFDDINEEGINNQKINENQNNSIPTHKVLFNINDPIKKKNNNNIKNNIPNINNNVYQMNWGKNQNFNANNNMMQINEFNYNINIQNDPNMINRGNNNNNFLLIN
jgi:hypothetical protein